MPILTIASGKGGVGKTASAHALGAAMRELGFDVVLLDLDHGADLTWSGGIDPAGEDAVKVLTGRASLDGVLVTTNDGLPILPGGPDVAQLEQGGNVARLAQRIRDLAGDRLLILDTAPGFASALTRAAIVAADLLVVPVLLEPGAARRAQHALDVADAFDAHPKPIVFATMVDPRRSITGAVRSQLAENGLYLVGAIPRRVAVAEAPNAGVSVLEYAPKVDASEAYRSLAGTIAATLTGQRGRRAATQRHSKTAPQRGGAAT